MNWEKFNHRLRKDAEEQNNEVDIDSIWGAIEPQVDEINLEKKKKRRAIFFWWGTGILLFSVGLWFLGNQFSQQKNTAQSFDNQKDTTEINHLKKENNANINAPIKPIQENDFGKNEATNSVSSTSSSNANLEGKATNLKRLNNASQKSSNANSNFSKNKNQPKTSNSKSKLSQSSDTNIVSSKERSIENLPLIVTPVASDDDETFRNPHAQKSQNNVQEKTKVTIFDISSLVNFLDFSVEKISLADEKKVWKPAFDESKNRFSIGIYGGANFTKRTLAAKNEGANILLQNRETYETPLETSQLGFNFSYKILNKEKYNLEISTGLQLTSIAERYRNFSTTTIDNPDGSFGVAFLSYGLGDEPIEIMGFVGSTTTTEYKKEIFNTYRMIDIPILIGYNRSFGKKWQAGIQAGIFANLSLKTEGIIPDANFHDVILVNDEFDVFKSNVGLSYHLGLNVKRKLSEHWDLNISPGVRYFGNDFSNANYGVSQKYVLFGGNVGVSYNF